MINGSSRYFLFISIFIYFIYNLCRVVGCVLMNLQIFSNIFRNVLLIERFDSEQVKQFWPLQTLDVHVLVGG